MASSGTNSMKEDTFKPVQNSQNADARNESRGKLEDASTPAEEVKAPGFAQRAVEEVQAITSEVWAAVTPSKK